MTPRTRPTRERILVIDPDQDAASALVDVLASAGYGDVASAGDLPTAIEHAASLAPALILIDLDLLAPADTLALGQLRACGDADHLAPIIVLTKDASDACKDHALRLGADDVLPKPLHHLEVAARVRNVLRHSRDARIRWHDVADAAALGTRVRMADAIHDGPLQAIASAAVTLQMLQHQATDEALASALGATATAVRAAATELSAILQSASRDL